ncbi:Fanconi anemia group F protein [Scleropages formosus]|uniref:FA complementation group F n=1 Tax=Scleropages formosus TaxID=113540 RepID=A0A8C9R0X8_SCLFO|nr:Fanconi anemia group F protein [Scleropages formosus]
MEAVSGDLKAVVHLMAVAQSDCVSCWEPRAARRALKWARHCERLHAQFHSDPGVRRVLEEQLVKAGEGLGGWTLTFPELARCEGLLIRSLLRNPALPPSVTKELLGAGGCAHVHSALPYLEDVIKYRAATELLSHLLESAMPMDPWIQTQGQMVRGRLDSILLQGDSERLSRDLLDSIMQDSAGDPRFPLVLAAAALSPGGGGSSGGRDATGAILDWLLGNRSQLLSFCRNVPSALLVDVAQRSSVFREAYYCILEDWGRSLRYDLHEAHWLPKSNSAVPFDALVGHFRALLDSPSLRERTENVLREMKAADGDFDVAGLSVWSDVFGGLPN